MRRLLLATAAVVMLPSAALAQVGPPLPGSGPSPFFPTVPAFNISQTSRFSYTESESNIMSATGDILINKSGTLGNVLTIGGGVFNTGSSVNQMTTGDYLIAKTVIVGSDFDHARSYTSSIGNVVEATTTYRFGYMESGAYGGQGPQIQYSLYSRADSQSLITNSEFASLDLVSQSGSNSYSHTSTSNRPNELDSITLNQISLMALGSVGYAHSNNTLSNVGVSDLKSSAVAFGNSASFDFLYGSTST